MLSFYFVLVSSNRFSGRRSTTANSMFDIYDGEKLIINNVNFIAKNDSREYTVPFDKHGIGFFHAIKVEPQIIPSPDKDLIILDLKVSNNFTNTLLFTPKVVFKNPIFAYKSKPDLIIKEVGNYNGFKIDAYAIFSYIDERTSINPSKIQLTDLIGKFGIKNPRLSNTDLHFEWNMVKIEPFNEITLRMYIAHSSIIEPAPTLVLKPDRQSAEPKEIVKYSGTLTGYKKGQNVVIYGVKENVPTPMFELTIEKANVPIEIEFIASYGEINIIFAASQLGVMSDLYFADVLTQVSLEITSSPDQTYMQDTSMLIGISTEGQADAILVIEFDDEHAIIHPLPEVKTNEKFDGYVLASLIKTHIKDGKRLFDQIPVGNYYVSIYIAVENTLYTSKKFIYPIQITPISMCQPFIKAMPREGYINMNQDSKISFVYKASDIGNENSIYMLFRGQLTKMHNFTSDGLTHNLEYKPEWYKYYKFKEQSYPKENITYFIIDSRGVISNCEESIIEFTFTALINKIKIQNAKINYMNQKSFINFNESEKVNINLIVYTQKLGRITIKYKYDNKTFEYEKRFRSHIIRKMANINLELELSGKKIIEFWAELRESTPWISSTGEPTEPETVELIPSVSSSVKLQDDNAQLVELKNQYKYQIEYSGNNNAATTVTLDYPDYPGYSKSFTVQPQENKIIIEHKIEEEDFINILRGHESYQKYDYTTSLSSRITMRFRLLDSEENPFSECSLTVLHTPAYETSISIASDKHEFNYYQLSIDVQVFDTSNEGYIDVVYSIDGSDPQIGFSITTTEFKTSTEPITRTLYAAIFQTDLNIPHHIKISVVNIKGIISQTASLEFNLVKKPVFETYPTIPSLIAAGESIKIFATIRGFAPTSEIPQFILLFEGSDENIHVQDAKWKTDDQDSLITIETTVLAPNAELTTNKVTFLFGVNNYGVSYELEGEFMIRARPKIIDTKIAKTKFKRDDEIPIELTVLVPTNKVGFKFSFGPYLDIEDNYSLDTTPNQNTLLNLSIPANTSTIVGPISLYISCFNEFSAITHLDIVIDDNYPPLIDVKPLQDQNVFYYYQNKVDFNISVFDYNIGDTDTVKVAVNGDDDIRDIKVITSQGKIFSFIYSFEYPKEDKNYTLDFGVVDSKEEVSNAIKYEFSVKRTQQVIIMNDFKSQYPYESKVTVNLHVVDFDPNEEIMIAFYNGTDYQNLDKNYTTGSNYSTDLISYTFTTLNRCDETNYGFIAGSIVTKNMTDTIAFSIRTNLPPKITIDSFINNTEYASTDEIHIIGKLSDDTFQEGSFYVQIDDYKAKQISRFSVTQTESNFDIQFHPIGKPGLHYFTFYFEDAFGLKSNRFYGIYTIQNISFKFTAELQKEVFHAHDPLILKVSIDANFGDNFVIDVYCKINELPFPYVIHTIDQNSFSDKIDIKLPFERINISTKLEIWAEEKNSGHKSEQLLFDFKQVVSPGVYFIKDPPRVFKSGEQWEAMLIIGDYPPGTIISYGFYLGNENDPMPPIQDCYISEYYTVGDDWKTENISLTMTIPEEGRIYYLHSFVITKALVIEAFKTFKFVVNRIPQIMEWKQLQLSYNPRSYIDVELIILDDASVSLYAAFDTQEFTEITRVVTNNANFTLKTQIPIDKTLSNDQHTLNLKLIDDLGGNSNISSQTFTIAAQSAPVFKAEIPKLVFNYDEEIEFLGSIFDPATYVNVTVTVQINSEEEHIILNKISNADIHVFSYNLENPHKNTIFNIVFKAYNSQNIKSNPIEFKIRIQQSKEVVLLSRKQNKLKCYVKDFEPGTELKIFLKVEKEINYINNVIIDSDYRSPKFIIDFINYPSGTIFAETATKERSKYLIISTQHELLNFEDETSLNKPKSLNKVSTLNINGFKQFYGPNEDIVLNYKIPNCCSEFVIHYSYDDGTSGGINIISSSGTITIPRSKLRKKQYLRIWNAEKSWYGYVNTNIPPNITLHENDKLAEMYYQPATVNFDLSIWDENSVSLYYQREEDGPVIPFKDSIIRCKGRTIDSVISVNIEHEEEESFNLIVFAKDDAGQTSNLVSKWVHIFTSEKPPKIKYIGISPEKVYLSGESILASIIIESNINTVHSIYYRFQNMRSQICKQFIAIESNSEVNIEIPAPAESGIVNLYIQVIHGDGSASKIVKKQINVQNNPSIIFKDLKSGYSTDEDVKLSVQLVGFEPGTYTFTSGSSSKTINVDNYYRSDNFVIDLSKLPIGINYVNFTVKSSAKVIKVDSKQIRIKNPPIFIIAHLIRNICFKNDFLQINYKIVDDGIVDIIYEILGNRYYIQKGLNVNGTQLLCNDQMYVNISGLDETEVYIYAIDEYGIKSKIITHYLTSNMDIEAPAIIANFEDIDVVYKRQFPFLHVNITATVPANQKYYLLQHFTNYFQYTGFDKPYTGSGNTQFIEKRIGLPLYYEPYEFIDVLIYVEMENGAMSKQYKKRIYSPTKPGIYIDKFKPGYSPNDKVVIHGYVPYFNMSKMTIVYSRMKSDKVDITNESESAIEIDVYPLGDPPQFTFEHEISQYEYYKFYVAGIIDGKVVAEAVTETVNLKPELTILTDINKEYIEGSTIHFDIKVQDNTKVQIRYVFDTDDPVNLTDWIECNYKEVIIKGLDIIADFDGPKRLQIYIVDDSNVESDRVQYNIVFTKIYKAPVALFWENTKSLVLFENVLEINLDFLWSSPGPKISFYYNIDNSEDYYIGSIENQHSPNFSYPTTILLSPGVHNVKIYAFDDAKNIFSIPASCIINVTTESNIHLPPILMNLDDGPYMHRYNEINLFNRYTANNNMDNLLENDLIPSYHSTVEIELSIGNNISKVDLNKLKYTTVHQFINKYQLSPQSEKATFHIKDDKTFVLPVIINEPPEMIIRNQINSKFFANGYIDVMIDVLYHGNVSLFYSIDGNEDIYILDVIQSNSEWQAYYTQILVPEGLSFNQHRIEFGALDPYGYYSSISHDFLYYDTHPPTIEFESIDQKFKSNETIYIKGKIDDLDTEDDLEIVFSANGGIDFNSVYTCSSQNRPNCQNFSINMSMHSNIGENSFIFQVRDSQGANSKNSFIHYSVEKVEGVDPKDVDDDKPKAKSFFDTVFGKYILWPLLALIVIIIVVIVVIVMKKKKNQSNDNYNQDNDQQNTSEDITNDLEDLETNIDQQQSEFTLDNPLSTTSVENPVNSNTMSSPAENSDQSAEIDTA